MNIREKNTLSNYDFTNRVIDTAVAYLETSRAQDKLGVFARRLTDIAYDSLAMLPFIDENDTDYFDFDNYEKTAIIPVATLAPNVRFYHDMTEPTPLQHVAARELMATTSDTKLHQDARLYGYDDDQGYSVTLSEAYDAATIIPAKKNNGTKFNYRPLIVLNETLRHEKNLGHAACVLLHEWSHGADCLAWPISSESDEDAALRTELRAYTVQSLVQQDLLGDVSLRQSNQTARRVEQVRMRVNGVSPFTDYAFDPNDEVKQALKFAALESVYKHVADKE